MSGNNILVCYDTLSKFIKFIAAGLKSVYVSKGQTA